MRLALPLLLAAAVCLAGANPPQHHSSSDRVYKHELSDWDHDEDEDEDDHKYDHDAFLGKEEAGRYDKMSPEESKENLGLLVEKIDKDKDGFVTEKELTDWVDRVGRRYIVEDSRKQFAEMAPGLEGKLSWEDYRAKRKDGDGDDDDSDDDDDDDEEGDGKDRKAASAKKEARDRRRWKMADADGDGLLDLREFTDFTHPEESPRLRQLVGQETLEDMDKNGDGYVDIDEYVADLWKPSDAEPQEPDWVAGERDTFRSQRDANADSKLDLAEVTDWIVPPDYNHAASEAKHLIGQADADKDGRLTKQEILDKHDVFAGSQATDFGEALGKHDEL